MDILTFISKIIESLAWPATVALFLLLFKEPIHALLWSIKKFKYKDLEIETEEVNLTQDPQVDQLMSVLQNSAHSFEWIRENSQLKFTDEEFEKIIAKHPNYFTRTRIVKRDEKGNRVKPGLPGAKLTNAALRELHADKD